LQRLTDDPAITISFLPKPFTFAAINFSIGATINRSMTTIAVRRKRSSLHLVFDRNMIE
jgi:hypothetical protein